MDWLSRIRSEPHAAPAGYQPPQVLYSPITPRTAAKTQDPNAPDYRYQVNQKCVYERELPGGSYITAHIQRLQSGYYDSPVVHEDTIENVRFIALNFVFHPSRKDYRFKSAEISIAIHHTSQDGLRPLDRVRNSVGLDNRSDHDHATQTETVSNALVRSREYLPPPRQRTKPTTLRPKFIRHSPHLLFGAISPETMDWNFNVAGSIGVSQGPASAAFKPSYGTKGSYKVYEMMRVQGSVRTLRSWHGHEYDVEDGEIVWTLEENRLQKSGLPREFTFVMLLTKGSGGIEPSDDITLDIDVHPKVSGPLGGTFPKAVTGLRGFQPFRKDPIDLDQDVGQVFEPSIPGRGFNFANLATNFDDFVWLPGTTYSTSDSPNSQQQQTAPPTTQPQGGQQLIQQPQRSASQSQPQPKQITSQPSAETTLQLRVILENARGSPVPITNANLHHSVLPYLHLKAPSRGPSPLPPSVAGSRRSKRSITIKSQAPSSGQAYSQRKRHTYADPHSHSRQASGGSTVSQPQLRHDSHTHSLRKTRSRSGLDKEYIRSESPADTREIQSQNQSQLFHDAKTGRSPPSTAAVEQSVEPVPQPSGERGDGVEPGGDGTPQYGDERQLEDDQERSRSEEHFEDMRQVAVGKLALPHEHEADLTPASRYNRFPSLSHTYSRGVQGTHAAQTYEQVGPATQTPPRTPPRAALEKPLPASPPVETEQIQPSQFDPEEQQPRGLEPETEPLTPPQGPSRDLGPSTPPRNPKSAPESPREPTLSPSTMLDPLTPPSQRKHQPDSESSTPPWHQHSSSLSPPSIPTTSNKVRPTNATPRFQRPPQDAINGTRDSTRQSHDRPEQGNWNDTPPEWASPTGSGSNTPTRNRSLRTRHATARALALQDQLTSQAHTGGRTQRGSEEYYRTPNITVPARGHSLRIQAGPQARAYATLPSQQPQETNTSSASGSGKTAPVPSEPSAPKYKYPAVPRSGAVATGVPSQARAQTHTQTHSRSSNSSRPQSKDGKKSMNIVRKPEKGGAFNYTQMLLEEPELDLDGEGESPPEYADASRPAAAQAGKYTQEEQRQLAEMERDAMVARMALSSSNPASSRQSSETAAPRAELSAHTQATQAQPVELGLDSPTLPTNTRTSRDTNRSRDRDVNRDREMPPVTKFASFDTGSGSDTNTRNSRRSSTEGKTKSKSSSKSRRESMSLIAKAQKYMRDAGYGSWGQGQSGSDREGESQAQSERSFEPPVGRGPLPGDRKARAGDTRALGVSGFIPRAETQTIAGQQHLRALSGDARASAVLTGIAPEQHDRGLISGQHEYEQDTSSYGRDTPTSNQPADTYDHDTSRYDQETPRYEQDNSPGRYELDTATPRDVRADQEYSDEHEALLGNRESQASFVSSNKDWRNTAGYATNMI